MNKLTRAKELCQHFYLSQGFMEAPEWENIGEDFQRGFLALADLESVRSPLTPRELAQEVLRWLSRDIPETVIATLKILLTRYIETGEWKDDIGIMIGEQPVPPLSVQRFALDRESVRSEALEKLAELSEKAAQGEWRVRRSSPQHIDVYAAPFEDADFVASELSPQVVAGIGLDYMPNADFIAALVNWFRANLNALQSPARSVRSEALCRDVVLEALEDGYGVLADITNQWEGRHTIDGQKLLCKMRDAIASATGVSGELVQDNAINPLKAVHSIELRK